MFKRIIEKLDKYKKNIETLHKAGYEEGKSGNIMLKLYQRPHKQGLNIDRSLKDVCLVSRTLDYVIMLEGVKEEDLATARKKELKRSAIAAAINVLAIGIPIGAAFFHNYLNHDFNESVKKTSEHLAENIESYVVIWGSLGVGSGVGTSILTQENYQSIPTKRVYFKEKALDHIVKKHNLTTQI